MKYFENGLHLLKMKVFRDYQTSDDNIIKQLDLITSAFDKKAIYYKADMIKKLIKYNVDGNWVKRINDSYKFGNDSTSLESYLTRYGEEVGTVLYNKRINELSYKGTLQYYIDKYGESIGKKKWDELNKSRATFSEKHYVERYGNELGKKKWQEVLNKKLKTQKDNFKNKKWKNGRTLEEYQERYGVSEGYRRWEKRNKNHSYMVSLQRYIDEFGEIEGRQICKDIKNNSSIDKFIERYGEELGKIRYEENCKKCGITLEKMIDLYGEEDGKERYKNWLGGVTSFKNNNGVSKSSQELFWLIYDRLDDNFKNLTYFHELNEEYKFYEHRVDTIKLHKVDFKLGNLIIEFDCEYWHDVEKDKLRDNFLTNHGYSVLRVRYKEYVKNKTEIVDKCIKYLTNET